MKSRKLLSLLLALMMVLSVVPFYASAAEPIALKATHVTEWPTAVGELYVGQILGEYITFVGGKVVYDGIEVPGKFIHWKAELAAEPANDATKANLTFVPDDTTTYKGFNKLFSTDVTYVVKKTTPVLADENNPPVATTIKEGQSLSSSTISGGTMANPYNSTIDLSSRVWQWENPDLVVTESGEYTAIWEGDTKAYEVVTRSIYVEVEKDIVTTVISESPTVAAITYDPNRTYADLVFEGGKVVAYGTETEVAGSWGMANDVWNTAVPGVGTYEIEVKFTPDEADKYLPVETKITITVAKEPFKFVDDNGTQIVPEITVPYGTTYGNLEYSLKAFKTNVTSSQGYGLRFENEKLTIPVGENEIDVTVVPYGDKNVETATVKVKVTVEPATVPMSVRVNTGSGIELKLNEIPLRVAKVNSSDATPQGSFDVYADGVLIADNVTGTFLWTPTETKEYTLRVVYNPTENDPCMVEEFTQAYPVTMTRIITKGENISAPVTALCGDEVTVVWQGAADFKGWVIKDTAGNEVDLGVDLSSDKIVFTMPDYNLTIEAKGGSSIGSGTGGILDGILGDGDLGNLTEGDSDCAIINIFNNIIAWFKNIIETITNLFRSIGDNT